MSDSISAAVAAYHRNLELEYQERDEEISECPGCGQELDQNGNCPSCGDNPGEDCPCIFCDPDIESEIGPEAPIVAEEWTTAELVKMVEYDWGWATEGYIRECVRRAKVELERRGVTCSH